MRFVFGKTGIWDAEIGSYDVWCIPQDVTLVNQIRCTSRWYVTGNGINEDLNVLIYDAFNIHVVNYKMLYNATKPPLCSR